MFSKSNTLIIYSKVFTSDRRDEMVANLSNIVNINLVEWNGNAYSFLRARTEEGFFPEYIYRKKKKMQLKLIACEF